MEKLLTYSALSLYIINYLVGWLLYIKVIMMKKITHQILYALIIINLAALFFFAELTLFGKMVILFSLFFMAMLPLGKKGGVYHIITSTLGLIFYLTYFFV
ncbi:MAG: hypothetical protein K1X86_01585 [Ignavibacteria bacterium]|nr:hypothetical protein [Ignavibacteria bacterium]